MLEGTSRVILGIMIILVPLLSQFNIQVEDKMIAIGLLGLGAIAIFWGIASFASGYLWIGVLLNGIFSLAGGALSVFGGWKEYESVTGAPLIRQQSAPAKNTYGKKGSGPKY